MKEVKRPTTVKGIVLIMITLMLLFAMGCGGDGDTAGTTDPVDPTNSPDGGNENLRLVCEKMLSPDFQSKHSLAIEKDHRGNNPIAEHEDIGTGDRWQPARLRRAGEYGAELSMSGYHI
jgi:hypothetical protein